MVELKPKHFHQLLLSILCFNPTIADILFIQVRGFTRV